MMVMMKILSKSVKDYENNLLDLEVVNYNN